MNSENVEMIVSQWKGLATLMSSNTSFAHPAGPSLLGDAALNLISGGAKSITLKLTAGPSSNGCVSTPALTIRW